MQRKALFAACLLGASVLASSADAQAPPAPPSAQLPRIDPDQPPAQNANPPGQAAPPGDASNPPPRPNVLARPIETPPPRPQALAPADVPPFLRTPVDPPLGFAGSSGILPSAVQESSHFVPVEDRWRVGFPEWDRYGNGHPPLDDYPYVEGNPADPFNQNVLKGDYPIIGNHTFLDVTASTVAVVEGHDVPTPAHGFESTHKPFELDFFGHPNQLFYQQNFILSLDLVHGDAGFKQPDWRIQLTPIFNLNFLDVDELGIVNPNVLRGTTRFRTWFTVEEYFLETKLADTSPYFDFVSLRAGSQFFTSDFRGFIFSDTNRAVRLFGTRLADRDQFNLVYFRQAEKDTNSELNTFDDRGQDVLIANYYHQDFIWPGYTMELSVHYNHDDPNDRLHFDRNSFLVRPDPVGAAKPHELDVVYLGWAGDGHIDRINIDHAFYWALGHDTLNPMAGFAQDINAQMAAIELSYDRDWARFRSSFFWASGDGDLNNHHATGFDAIFDNPNFAGGRFSFWQSQAIQLFGVHLTNRGSLLADLRSSKIEGQSNFVNPGLKLVNFGIDFEMTPKLRMVNNVNLLWFDDPNVLQQFLFDPHIHRFIGVDPSMGFEYRPLLSNNVIMTFGISGLLPGEGFRDIYDKINGDVNPLVAAFVQVNLNF